MANHISGLIPHGGRVLDVGCGDGTIDMLISRQRPDITVTGLDVLARPNAKIKVEKFDGLNLPYPDQSFDVVMLVDVLHHAMAPRALLGEAARVGKELLIKDHYCDSPFATATLTFMDWVGNAHHGVALHYEYWSRPQWEEVLDELGLKAVVVQPALGLYPTPASWVFERGLHFLMKLERS